MLSDLLVVATRANKESMVANWGAFVECRWDFNKPLDASHCLHILDNAMHQIDLGTQDTRSVYAKSDYQLAYKYVAEYNHKV